MAVVPVGKVVHVILDNYAPHKHPKVRAWLEKHSRWVFHFAPTSASWLNAVEGFFAKLTRKRLRRGCFRGIVDLKAAHPPLHQGARQVGQALRLDPQILAP